MEKINALKNTNTLLSRMIKSLDYSINGAGSERYNSELLYQSSNSETSLSIYQIDTNQISDTMEENEFQRLICIGGEVRITILDGYDEDVVLTSSNTILIPPQTKFKIETLKDSQVIVVFKPKKDVLEKVLVKETIYNKL